MPGPAAFKCVTCLKAINKTQASVQCGGCAKWLHLTCTDIPEKVISVLKDVKTLSVMCPICQNNNGETSSLREEMRSMNDKFERFLEHSQQNSDSIKSAIAGAIADFKSEVTACRKELGAEIVDCRKLVNYVDTSLSLKISALETENNVLHRRMNRGDIVIGGLPSGLDDLYGAVLAIGSFFNINLTNHDISHVCYMSGRKLILAKFNCVRVRDGLMKAYFKDRSLKVLNVIGGEIDSRVYLNDHYSPAAGNMNALCRKLLKRQVILKYKIINADKLKAKITFADGREAVYDSAECAALYDGDVE